MPGKRKRSAREKSVESGEIFCSGRSRTASLGEEGLSSMEKMDMEEIGSSSSLSSSEWEDVHSDGGPEGEVGMIWSEIHCIVFINIYKDGPGCQVIRG